MKKHNTYMYRVVRDITYEEDRGLLYQILYIRSDLENECDELLRVYNPLDKHAFAVGDIVTLGVCGGADRYPGLFVV